MRAPLIRRTGGFAAGSSSSMRGSRLRGGKDVSATANVSTLEFWVTPSFQERRVQREVCVSKAVLRCPGLVPVRVDERRLAHFVEARALILAELHVDRGEIVPELRLGPPADDQ